LKLPFYIARRYLFSKKSHNAINIISMVSVCGVVVVTIALICALSVLNGFSGLVYSMFSNFDPELKALPSTGKVFTPSEDKIKAIKALPEIELVSKVLEDNVLIKYGERQHIAIIKGVDENFGQLIDINKILIDGEYRLREDVVDYASLGIGTASILGISANFVAPMTLYVPKRDEAVNMSNPASSFNIEYAYISSVFCVNQQVYDENYIVASLPLVRSLFRYENEVSALEIKLTKRGSNINAVKAKLTEILGNDVVVKDRYEQQEASFKMMQIEKWMIFLILCFILIISLFNVVGSLSMLMIEKQADVRTLRSLGADDKLINNIFLFEGWMISGIGTLIGLVIGLTICLLQQTFGIIKLGQTGVAFIIEAYPVKVLPSDVILVAVTVLSVGFLAAWYAVHYLGKRWIKEEK